MFCFTSTTFKVVINVSTAVYFNKDQLRSLLQYYKEVAQISPQSHVTMENVLALGYLYFPGQRGDQTSLLERQIEGAGKLRRVVHGNSTPVYSQTYLMLNLKQQNVVLLLQNPDAKP